MNNEKKITPQVIGANIRRIRLKHGETQQKLGALLGYGATTVANYESGYRLPDLETFFQIALHYGASLEDFIQDSEYMESETPEDVHES
jgi:transcriptional regulator with XRE-family HTH domain